MRVLRMRPRRPPSRRPWRPHAAPSRENPELTFSSIPGEEESLEAVLAEKEDYSCLLSPPLVRRDTTERYTGPADAASVVEFVNAVAGTHRLPSGEQTPYGQAIDSVAASLYTPPETEGGGACDEVPIEAMSRQRFVSDYVLRNRPVLLKGAASHWPALQRWTTGHLRNASGDMKVHVKVSPDGRFEGVEPILGWEDSHSQYVPPHVLWRLQSPDLAVVRPAVQDIPLRQLLGNLSRTDASYYVEYLSLASNLPALAGDVTGYFDLDRDLALDHENVWIGNGRTIGKLHFDPFENLLAVVAGSKSLTLLDARDNRNLYEGHIREAMLDFDPETREFRRQRLAESTSIVNSPVELEEPDLERFPRAAQALARRVECTVEEGDALYLPAFWWHEVRSRPNAEGINIAVNRWYRPVLTKPFPCAGCPLAFNEADYSALLPFL